MHDPDFYFDAELRTSFLTTNMGMELFGYNDEKEKYIKKCEKQVHIIYLSRAQPIMLSLLTLMFISSA